MDRNSITGVILIVLIVVGYNALFPPVIEVEVETSDNNTTVILEESTIEETNTNIVSDTTNLNDLHQRTYGVFAGSALGSDEDIVIENDVLKLSISPKGGRIVSAILKDYQTTDSLPLNLVDRDSSVFNITF